MHTRPTKKKKSQIAFTVAEHSEPRVGHYFTDSLRLCTSRKFVWTLTLAMTNRQKDFARREELRRSDVEVWLGFITFLCEVFGIIRSSSGEPFRVLVCPIYTCLREVCIVCTTILYGLTTTATREKAFHSTGSSPSAIAFYQLFPFAMASPKKIKNKKANQPTYKVD